ncbi:MAG TPA: DUF3263 domain-containing protein [Actinomycetota bacterium]|jgi:hypothetical protein|nr:DUF3263 domain-containing protein [Actinomycetota bacterium]
MAAQPDAEWRWQDILDFERNWWKVSVRKELAVRTRFGISAARYYQLLNRLIDQPEALEYDPMLVQRLRRLREARRRRRFARRLGPQT